jgi:hypothetical protein
VVTGKGTVTGGGISCGNGVTTCSAGETANSTVTLTATPAHGASFTGWAVDCAGTATTCMVTMDAAKSVSATFAGAAARRTLTIKVAGRGTVRSSAGKCVGDGRKKKTCVQRFASGTRIVLTAIPAAGGRFSRWGGACTGKKKKCTVTLRTAKTVTATFTSRRREF